MIVCLIQYLLLICHYLNSPKGKGYVKIAQLLTCHCSGNLRSPARGRRRGRGRGSGWNDDDTYNYPDSSVHKVLMSDMQREAKSYITSHCALDEIFCTSILILMTALHTR